MIRYTQLLIYLFFSINLLAQPTENTILKARHKLDSLNTELLIAKYDTSKALNLIKTSFWYDDLLKFDSSIINLEKAYYIAKKNNYAYGLKAALLLLSQHYIENNRDVKGLSLCLELVKIAEINTDTLFLIDSYRTIGNLFRKMKDYKKNLLYQKRSLSLCLSKRLDSISGFFYNIVGDAYMQLLQFDSANIYFQKGLQVSNKYEYKYDIAFSNLNLGELNLKTKNYDLAAVYLRRSLSLYKSIDGQDNIENCIDLATLFKETKQTDSMIFYARKSYELSRIYGFTQGALEAALIQTTFYQSRKNMDSAFKYQQIMLILKDSLFNVEKTREIQNISTVESLRQNEILEKEKEIQEERKYNLQLGAIALFIPSFITFILVLSKRKSSYKLINFLGIISLLMLFEFINLFLHPHLEKITNHNPPLMLSILVFIGILLVPLHHKLEFLIKERIVLNITKHKRRLAFIEKAKQMEVEEDKKLSQNQ